MNVSHFFKLLGELFVFGMIFAFVASGSASARVCAQSGVAATGAPAYFKFAATSQARAAWRRKVIAKSNLGQAYSRWSQARDAQITCRKIADRYRCVAVGDACRAGEPTVTAKTRRGPA